MTFIEDEHPRDAGKFTDESQSVPETELAAPDEALALTVAIHASVELRRDWFDELPDWPAGKTAPVVSFDFDEGKVESHFIIGDKQVAAWTGGDGSIYNSYADSMSASDRDRFGWDDEQADAAVEYFCAVHERIGNLSYAATLAAVKGDAQNAMIAQATNTTFVPERTPVFTAAEMENNAPKTAVSRAEGVLAGWFLEPGKTQDSDAVVLQDALTDLVHWADAQGLDFNEILARASFIHQSEVFQPEM